MKDSDENRDETSVKNLPTRMPSTKKTGSILVSVCTINNVAPTFYGSRCYLTPSSTQREEKQQRLVKGRLEINKVDNDKREDGFRMQACHRLWHRAILSVVSVQNKDYFVKLCLVLTSVGVSSIYIYI